MDPVSLAATAAAAVGGYLVRMTSSAAEQAADKAGGKLVQLVSDRLQASRKGRGVLLDLQDRPADTERREAVAGVLAEEFARNPKFAKAVAKLVAPQPPVTTSGDGDVVNTGSWDNRRGTVATGGSRVDQSRHFRFGSGLPGWVAVLVAVAAVTTTAGVAIGNSGPAYPELEGDWSGRTLGGTRIAMHVTDDRFTFEVVGGGGEQLRCTGTVTQDDDTHYGLGTKEGVCGRIAVTGRSDGKVDFEFDAGPDGVLKRD
jgi:hypothetical protein